MRTFFATLFALTLLSTGNFGDSDLRPQAKKNAGDLGVVPMGLDHYHRVEAPDPRFESVAEVRFTLPPSYNHHTQLEDFGALQKNHAQNFSPLLTNEIFTKSAWPFVAGKTYTVRIYSFTQEVTYDDCREFMRKNHAKCAGAPGLAILWQMKRSVFPKEKGVLSFNETDITIVQDVDNVSILPIIVTHVDEKGRMLWRFSLTRLEKFGTKYCILCVFDDEDVKK